MAMLAAGIQLYSAMEAADAEEEAAQQDRIRSAHVAKALELDAKNVAAAKQREAFEEQRAAELIASRALALAAAGGGSASDPTVMNIIADIESEGAYRAAVSMYEGESEAEQLRFQAEYTRKYGESQYQAGQTRAKARRASGVGQAIQTAYG